MPLKVLKSVVTNAASLATKPAVVAGRFAQSLEVLPSFLVAVGKATIGKITP